MDIIYSQVNSRKLFGWREALAPMLFLTSGFLLLSSLTLFAQATTASEPEKWIGPVMTSVTNLFGSFIAFMTAREIRRDDSEKKILRASLDSEQKKCVDYESEIEECKTDRAKIRNQLNRAERRITKLMRLNGVDDDELDPDDSVDGERRIGDDPNYKGPRRRKDDKDDKDD